MKNNHSSNVFGEEIPDSERLVFVPDNGPIEERPVRVEDPPPRPLPRKIERSADAWIPGGKVRNGSFLAIIGRVSIGIVSMAVLAGVFYLVIKVFQSYM